MGFVEGTGAYPCWPCFHPNFSTSNDGVCNMSQSLAWRYALRECCAAASVVGGSFSGLMVPAAARLLKVSNLTSSKSISVFPLKMILNTLQPVSMMASFVARVSRKTSIALSAFSVLQSLFTRLDLINPDIADTVSQPEKLCKKTKYLRCLSGRASLIFAISYDVSLAVLRKMGWSAARP